jgi:exosortase
MMEKKWLRTLFGLGAFATLWLLLFKHLAGHWSTNPQYSFGWLVPFLGLYLLYRRWESRPAPAEPLWRSLAAGGVLLAALAFFPIWLVVQPNPDWRFVGWLLALDVVAISLGTIYLLGGSGWLRHFAFPICFVLSAIPWFFQIEQVVIQNLMQLVAGVTVELLTVFGVPALQQGNLIEISGGTLDVDQACSGVRSLQATLMASLFLGELYRFAMGGRLALVITGAALAICCNIARAFFLAWIAAHRGLTAISQWHDPAGFAILTICFALLWLLCLCFTWKKKDAPLGSVGVPPASPLPWSWIIGFCVLIFAALAGTEAWYRMHERGEKLRWSFTPPIDATQFQAVPIQPDIAKLLQFDQGSGAVWRENDGSVWTAFFFEWAAGPARSRILARSHRPEICLPASGFRLSSDLGLVEVNAADLKIPFQAFRFDGNGLPLYVFFCTWQDRTLEEKSQTFRKDWGRMVGLESVWRGERNLGQRVLEVIVSGYKSSAEAEREVRARLARWIKREA